MNFLGHHEIARHLDETEDHTFMFGAMVPDLTGMLRLKKLYKSQPVEDKQIQKGLEVHARTNRVFDDNPAIKALELSMTTSFREYLPKWTGTQCARAGKDILFDGLFFSDETALESYHETMRLAASGRMNFGSITVPIDSFTEGVKRLEEMRIPRYDDPFVVAKSLQRRFVGTRTPLAKESVPEVTMTLANYQPIVLSIGRTVVSEVIAVLQT